MMLKTIYMGDRGNKLSSCKISGRYLLNKKVVKLWNCIASFTASQHCLIMYYKKIQWDVVRDWLMEGDVHEVKQR